MSDSRICPVTTRCTDPDLIAALPGLTVVSANRPGQVVLSAPEPHLLMLLASSTATFSSKVTKDIVDASCSFIPLNPDGVTLIVRHASDDVNNDRAELFNVRIEDSEAWAEPIAQPLFVNWQPVTEERPTAPLQPGAFIACAGCLYMFNWDQVLPRCQRALLGNLCLLKDQPDPARLRREAVNLARQVDRLSSAAERRSRIAARVLDAFNNLESVLAGQNSQSSLGLGREPLALLALSNETVVTKALLCASINTPGLRVSSAMESVNVSRGCAAVTLVANSLGCQEPQLESLSSSTKSSLLNGNCTNFIRLTASAPRTRLAVSALADPIDDQDEFNNELENNSSLVTMATDRQLSLLAFVGKQLVDMLTKLNEEPVVADVSSQTGKHDLCQHLFDPLCDLAKTLMDAGSLSNTASANPTVAMTTVNAEDNSCSNSDENLY